jgi:peptidoglycan/xylan/chitin deacetylase (PgdA/CDA1 family)
LTKPAGHMKNLLFKMLRYSGLPFLFRELVQRNRVTILLYHDIEPEAFEKNLEFLSAHYNIIALGDYIKACREKNSRKLPPKSLILTFDDGHIGNYALKNLLERYRVPVTIFLCAGIINTNRHFWFTFKHPEVPKSALKRLPNREKLNRLQKAGFGPETEFEKPQAMNREQIMALKPLVDFQAHTIFHPCLPQCDDAEAREEIITAKTMLENEYHLDINAIAYPNGDYSERDIALSMEAGYDCGITVDFGYNTVHTDPFRLKRLSVNDTGSPDELAVKASGLWAFFKTKNGSRNGFGQAVRSTLKQPDYTSI